MGNAISGLRKAKGDGGLGALLDGTTLDDIRARQSIAVLTDDETVEEALQASPGEPLLDAPRAKRTAGACRAACDRRQSLGLASLAACLGGEGDPIPEGSAQIPRLLNAAAHARDACVQSRAQELATRRVLSAPVRLSSPPGPPDGSGATIFGFVDVRDIVSSFFRGEPLSRGLVDPSQKSPQARLVCPSLRRRWQLRPA
jgi:hypothetical protein